MYYYGVPGKERPWLEKATTTSSLKVNLNALIILWALLNVE